MLLAMSDDKPNPFDDVRKGLGLLFRAAKTTVEKLPTKDLEAVVVTSAREVGRAIENVGKTLEREVFGKRSEPRGRDRGDREPSSGAGEGKGETSGEAKPDDDSKPPDAAE
jgi:hypothetical protein